LVIVIHEIVMVFEFDFTTSTNRKYPTIKRNTKNIPNFVPY